jgi:hypothetical protein
MTSFLFGKENFSRTILSQQKPLTEAGPMR